MDFDLGVTPPVAGACANGIIHLDILYDVICSILRETSEPGTAARAADGLAVIEEARVNLVMQPANDV